MSQDFLRIIKGQTSKFKEAWERVPSAWVLGVEFVDGEMVSHEFRLTHSLEFEDFLRDVEKNERVVKCYGVWPGQWRTDLFEIDPEEYLRRPGKR